MGKKQEPGPVYPAKMYIRHDWEDGYYSAEEDIAEHAVICEDVVVGVYTLTEIVTVQGAVSVKRK